MWHIALMSDLTPAQHIRSTEEKAFAHLLQNLPSLLRSVQAGSRRLCLRGKWRMEAWTLCAFCPIRIFHPPQKEPSLHQRLFAYVFSAPYCTIRPSITAAFMLFTLYQLAMPGFNAYFLAAT